MNRLTPAKQAQVIAALERQNLTMRMQMRRFTRFTNAFSMKVENLGWAVALHFMQYNFCRVHQTLRVTHAMEAGIADHVWTISEVIGLQDVIEKWHKNTEAGLSTGLAPESRRTRGGKLVNLDYDIYVLDSQKTTT